MDVGDLHDVQQIAARVEDAIAGSGQIVVLGAAGGRRRVHRVVIRERVVRERAARH